MAQQIQNREDKIKAVWDWFLAHKDLMMDIESMDRKDQRNIMREFENIMAEYSEGLTFEVREPMDDIEDMISPKMQLIISAEGNEDYFPDVIDLTTHAPAMELWDVVPFRPAEGLKVN